MPKSATIRLALVAVACVISVSARAASDTENSSAESKGQSIEEIVVTAQKRSEKLMDVPTSISAISGDRLESMQINTLADLASFVPGMSVQELGAPGAREIILRGLNTSYNNATTASTVATYIDDLPVGSSTAAGRGGQYGADLQPYDIERIEVLKGPQGTLYGANTLGGLVKYVSRQPDLNQFEARAGTDVAHVNDAGGADWGVRAAVNLPIVPDELAVRISGFKKHDAGYINNIGIGVEDANASIQQGGRAALLWRATDRLTVRAAVLAENDNADSISVITMNGFTQRPLYGPQVVNTHFPQPYEQTTRNYSLSIDWDLGFATLTSASGQSEINWRRGGDYTVPYGSYCAPGKLSPTNPGCVDYPFGNALALYDFGANISKFVEEVRLVSPQKQRIQWMLGGFYTKENTVDMSNLPTFTPAGVPLPMRNNLLISNSPGTYKESAAFANLTYQFTDRFDISGGVRHSIYSQSTYDVTESGVIYGGVSLTPPNSTLPNVGVTTWMADARYHPSGDTTLYARVATGYRPGNGCKFYSNGTPCGTPALGVPGFVNPDRTTNYETGFKGLFLDQRLQLDMAVFYVKWLDIQIPTISPQGIDYAGNGGTASSQGVELTTSYQVAQGLRLNATLAYTNAHLDEDALAVGGRSGDRLPEAPVWTGSLTADYSRPVGEHMSFLLGGGYRYRDAIVNLLEHTGTPVPMGPQNLVDVYTGLTMRKLTWRLTGSNVFNNHSYAGLILLSNPSMPEFVPVRPRTIGLSVDYQF